MLCLVVLLCWALACVLQVPPCHHVIGVHGQATCTGGDGPVQPYDNVVRAGFSTKTRSAGGSNAAVAGPNGPAAAGNQRRHGPVHEVVEQHIARAAAAACRAAGV